ncbi:MAG: histidine kinase [Prolixibacteraceae bacterium]|nr:histidine kinase [Prolixibacteraceae bacterium]MBN2775048.1 histidine kinase [Prolixibacteraceae bacterium]
MDFRHPFISKPKLAIAYAIFWVIISIAYFLIQWLSSGIPADKAIVEAITSVSLYGVLGTSIWYVVRFNTLEENTYSRFFIVHIISAAIILILWLYIGAVIIKLFFPIDESWTNEFLPARIYSGFMFYLFYVIFFYAVTYYQNFKDKVRRESELKALVKEAELHALKSQINPHFLFNSLNSISSLTMSDPQKAQEMVINLSSIMRYSLKYDQNEVVTFGTEIENIKMYLQIEKVRFGKKLNPVFEISESCLDAEIPNMILQPLFENAIKYGVYEATEPVDVVTSCRKVDNFIEIKIRNNYDPEVLHKKGEGIGLRNIRDRLQVIYNNPGLIKIRDFNNNFTVTLMIPQK